jgi:hypothetical protein
MPGGQGTGVARGLTASNIAEAIDESINRSDGRRFLVSVKTGKIVHVNLTILSHFLRTLKGSGIYISIDRPHKYIELLLRKKEIPQEGVYYVDIATRRSGGERGGYSLLSIGGFLWLKILANTFEDLYIANGKKPEKVDFFNMDFVLIDNAAVLPAFNSMDSIREFFSELGNLVRDHQKMRTYIVVPKDLHPKMFETLRNFVDQIIEIPDEWVL